jgi:hypothetical protein
MILHMDLEFEDIILSVRDRLCLVPYVSSYIWSCLDLKMYSITS